MGLKEGQCIIGGGKRYQLLEDAKENARNGFSTWTAKVKKVSENGQEDEIYFLKFTEILDKTGKQGLEREGKFRMHHPYIEHVYGSFEAEDEKGSEFYCVLAEYIDGEDLRDYRANQLLNEKEMFRYMIQILYGVQYYTNFKSDDPYVHRDLKPENIMVSYVYDKVLIIDFDWAHISKSRSTQLYQTAIGGTLGFADPRAYQSNMTDVKMDIYSLGRVFCFWLRGRNYFNKEEEERYKFEWEEKLAYGLDLEKIPEKYKEPQYKDFLQIIAKMVAPVETRYGDVSEILKDMRSFLENYYGGPEEYQKIFGEETILKSPADRYIKGGIRAGVSNSLEKKRESGVWENYRIRDVKIKEQPVMSVYNLDGKLYYIPLREELTKENDDGSYRIYNRDVFHFQGIDIDFLVSESTGGKEEC